MARSSGSDSVVGPLAEDAYMEPASQLAASLPVLSHSVSAANPRRRQCTSTFYRFIQYPTLSSVSIIDFSTLPVDPTTTHLPNTWWTSSVDSTSSEHVHTITSSFVTPSLRSKMTANMTTPTAVPRSPERLSDSNPAASVSSPCPQDSSKPSPSPLQDFPRFVTRWMALHQLV